MHSLIWDFERPACEEEEKCHQWKCRQEKISTSESVDGIDGWEGEYPIYKTEPQRRAERIDRGEICI